VAGLVSVAGLDLTRGRFLAGTESVIPRLPYRTSFFGAPMDRVRQYQRHAAECLLLSEQAADPVTRGKLLAMAQAWARLVELAERNSRPAPAYDRSPRPERASMP
jgi:hypothetical protein